MNTIELLRAIGLEGFRIEPRTVNEVVSLAMASKEQRMLRHSYIIALKSALKMFAARFGEREIHSLTAAEIDDWLCNPSWNAATRKGYLCHVRTLFSFAVKRRWCAMNVACDVDWPMPEPAQTQLLTPAQARELLAVAHHVAPAMLCFLALTLFGFLRVIEARRIDADDIRTDYIHVKGHKAKTRNRRLVPMNPALRTWLAVSPPPPIVNWRKQFAEVCRQLSFELPRNALRHSAVSYGVPIYGARDVALWAGHSEKVLFNTYRELATVEQAREYFAILPRCPQLELAFQ